LIKIADIDIDKVIHCYYNYMKHTNSELPIREQYIKNLEDKMSDPEFIGDTVALIRPEENWNADQAYQLIKNKILMKL